MSKKAFALLILFILAVFGVLGWYFLFRGETLPDGNTQTTDTRNPFPFGQGNTGSSTPIGNNPSSTGSTTTIDITPGLNSEKPPRLRQVSSVPSAGAIIFGTENPTIRYIERATGHVYEAQSDSLAVRRVSSVTIPKIHEALWADDGSKLIIRYLKDDEETIRTFSAKISPNARTEAALEGIFLPDGIKTLSIFGNKLFYVIESSSGAQGSISNLDGSSRTSAFSSPYSEWSSIWNTATSIILYTRPSALSVGSAFVLEPATGRLARVTGDEIGLSAIGNTDGSLVLISGRGGRGVSTAVLDVKASSSNLLSLSTLAEKCAWSSKEKDVVYCAVPYAFPSGAYPDDWYKGKVSFSDSLWRISTKTGETEEIMNPELEAGVSMDMIKLDLDPNETAVLFTNKKDMTVWSYRLEE